MKAFETYLQNMRQIRSTGAGVPETSYYGALETLFNEIGRKSIFKVRRQGKRRIWFILSGNQQLPDHLAIAGGGCHTLFYLFLP